MATLLSRNTAVADADAPTPLTWRKVHPGPPGSRFARDIALCTCRNGHTCLLSGDVHAVAADGTVTPSYVCPVDGCGFHEWVQLVEWEG